MLVNPLKQCALVALVAAVVMFTNLGGPRLWDRDEPRNAGCAREMLTRGDWVVPVFNGQLRTHKPVLLYWCIMSAYSVLGVGELAARLPSALAAVGSALCTWRMGRRLFGPSAGVWAGISLATSLMFVVAGRAATPDSLLIFATTLAMTIYVCGTFRPRFETTPADAEPEAIVAGQYFPQHWPTVVMMYAAMGLGVLAKGPVGLVLPTAVIGMFLLIMRLPARDQIAAPWLSAQMLGRLVAPFEPLHFLATCWSMRPFTAVFAAAAVALPWYWAVGLATGGDFLRSFFLEHNLGRAAGTMENHSGSIFFYPAAILVGFFPWSVFAAPLAIDTALQLRPARNSTTTHHSPLTTGSFHPGYLLAVCWIGVYVVLFSLARTKLPSYVTPCYPALAILAGNYVDRFSRQAVAVGGGWLIAAFGCLAIVGAAVAIGVPLAAKKLLPGEEWLGLIGLVPLAGGVACLGLASVRSFRASSAAFAMTAVSFVTLLFAVGADRVDKHQTSHQLWQAIYSRSPNPIVASYKVLEPSWVFYGGRTIHEFAPATPADGQAAASQAAELLATVPDAFVITTEQKAREVLDRSPPEIGVIETTPYFLHGQERLVVIGQTIRR
jgi:4-amino-4-deoxy-L-arabinose transferase-like glycosyltransferase